MISRSLFDPPVTLFAVVGVAALLGAGLAFLRKRPIIGFGICFLLIGLLPEAIVVPHFQFCSYRVILPMVGLLLVIADAALLIVEKSANHVLRSNAFRAVAALLLIAASLLGASTFIKNASWYDPVLMWKQALEASPRFGPNVEKRIYAEILNNLGEALVGAGKASDAIQYFQRSVRIQPHVPQGLFNLAIVMEQTGKIPQAMKYYKMVLSRDPGHAETHNNLGLLLREEGKFAEAKEHFRRAVKSKPHLARARRNYGIALMESGEVSEALKQFVKAVQIEPDSAEGHYDLGVAYAVVQDLPWAIRHFRQAVRIDPANAKAHHNLAIALLKSGHKPEAMYHLKRALEIDPDLAKPKRIAPPTKNNGKASPEQGSGRHPAKTSGD
jgi:Flp pilus assembly protein TadD